MILCVCLSPAVDVTYHVDGLDPTGTTRVRSVTERPGGKAVNVARVLHGLGEPVHLVAPVGGPAGDQLQQDLDAAGLATTLVPTSRPTRRTVTVVPSDGGHPQTLVEPASLDCWPALAEAVDTAMDDAALLVVSGSLPEGVPDDGLATLVASADERGRPVIVDTHGPALLAALAAGASLVKPNAHELRAITRHGDLHEAARDLAASHVATVVASLGADGVIAAGPTGVWEARPRATLAGNPTGAGDALVAGLARGVAHDPLALAMPERMLQDAVALSAAAVLSPEAGEVDPGHHRDQLESVVVRAWEGAR